MTKAQALEEIKINVYNLIFEYKKSYDIAPTQEKKEKFDLAVEYYKRINDATSFDEIDRLFVEIHSELRTLITSNSDSYRVELLTNLINIFSTELSKVLSTNKEIKKQTEKQKTPVYSKGEEEDINKRILSLKEKQLADNSLETRRKINALCDSRMDIASLYLGNEGINLVREIESLESRYVRCNNTGGSKDIIMTSKEYLRELMNVINSINSSCFNRRLPLNEREKAYNESVKKIRNLIISLFGDENIMIESTEGITTTDLVSYLTIYNLDEKYDSFVSAHGTNVIGNETITKREYTQRVNYLKSLIESLSNQCTIALNGIGGNVLVKDHSIQKSILLLELNNKIKLLNEKIKQAEEGKKKAL